MSRSVSAPMAAALAKKHRGVAHFIEIEWGTFSSKFCTYGTLAWNGSTWNGEGVELGAFDADGRPLLLLIADPAAAWRTVFLVHGVRDRRINCWEVDISALGVDDPVLLPVSYGDAFSWDGESGRLSLHLGAGTSRAQFTPRERLGPAVGINHIAPANLTMQWGDRIVTFKTRANA